MPRHVGSPPIAAKIRDVAEVINTPFRFVQDALRFPKSERRCERRLQESLERRPNVLMVYSAPKTASTSVAAAIEACDAFTVIKVHHAAIFRTTRWRDSGGIAGTRSDCV